VRLSLDIPPIILLAVAFAAGIAGAARWTAPTSAVIAMGIAGAAIWAVGRWSSASGWRLLGVLLAVAALGAGRATIHTARQPRWPDALDGRQVIARGTVLTPPEATLRGWRAVVRLHEIDPLPEAAGVGRRRTPRARQPPVTAPDPPRGGAIRVADRVRLTGGGDPPAITSGTEVTVRGWFRAGRPAGNPGERSERDALRRRGLAGVVSVSGQNPASAIAVGRQGGWSPRGVIGAVRRRVITTALTGLPAPYGGLLLSLLLGIDTHLDPALYQQFSRAGLVHLMVVSGAQVAIVAGVWAWAGRLVRLSVSLATLCTGVGIAAFAALIDWAPSIGRAVIMAVVGLGGILLGRPRDPAATLSVAAVALLAADPTSLFDIGFQLSFAATWGLLYLAPVLERLLSGLGPRVGAALGVTVGAQLSVAPLLAAHFQSLPVAGLLANVLVLPLIAVLVPAGFAMILPVVLLPGLGAALLRLLQPGLAAVLWIGARFGDLSWSTVSTPPVPSWAAAAMLGLLGMGVAVDTRRATLPLARRLAAAALAALVIGAWYVGATLPPTHLAVTVLDVGQGDSILIQSPGGRAMLIDGGGEVGPARGGWDVGRMRVVPALRRAGVRRLDVVVLTHPHEDHVGGLPAVLENFPVGLVLDPGVSHPSPSYVRLLKMVEAGRIPYRAARAGMRIDLGAGAVVTILHPPEPIPTLPGDQVNAGSVVARLAFGITSMIFTGDAEASVERYLLDRGMVEASQVLKVGHHGSRTSTTPIFVDAVRPRDAVISAGADNSFGHPHAVTLQTLAAAGVRVWRTDLDGAVRLESNGMTWRITTGRVRLDAGIH
jgi:competence protein ComEC